MFERETRLYRLMLGYLQTVVKDFDESQLILPMFENANPPAWILAHLAIANDSVLKCLGQPPICPAEWHASFGRGKNPRELTISYPSKSELLAKIEQGHALICDAASKADSQTMDQPHSVSIFKGTPVESLGDLVALLMTTHFSTHIGQLSLMRRQLGYAPVF